MSRMDDAAIREAMQSDGLPPESGGTILRLAVEALARGEEIAALERSEQRLAACVSNGDGNIRRLEREAEGLRAEVARLRAAAFPEDAEEIVFKELSIGVFEPQDLEIQEAIHAKRRAKARAVVKALRGNA